MARSYDNILLQGETPNYWMEVMVTIFSFFKISAFVYITFYSPIRLFDILVFLLANYAQQLLSVLATGIMKKRYYYLHNSFSPNLSTEGLINPLVRLETHKRRMFNNLLIINCVIFSLCNLISIAISCYIDRLRFNQAELIELTIIYIGNLLWDIANWWLSNQNTGHILW